MKDRHARTIAASLLIGLGAIAYSIAETATRSEFGYVIAIGAIAAGVFVGLYPFQPKNVSETD